MPVIFYDLETFGLSPGKDRVAEFAGISTDESLELLEQPREFRCLPPPDYLASPGACLTTGITPQDALQTGLPEPDFARRIEQLFTSQPRTLILGYNNASFDDEFVRHLFWRTFLDPYQWHYGDGNRRIDMLSVVPALFDFHRDLLFWPRTPEGLPDFRLEALATANDALAGTSHEALADTFALRNLSKLIQERAPEVWDSLPLLLDKKRVEEHLRTALRRGPADGWVIYASARMRRAERSSSLFIVLGREAGPSGQWWLLDLGEDPRQLLGREPEEVAADRPRTPLQRINPRRFPFVIPAGRRQIERFEEIALPLERVERNRDAAVTAGVSEWGARFVAARGGDDGDDGSSPHPDVDQRLYAGFPPDRDRSVIEAARFRSTAGIAELLTTVTFIDERYTELQRRFRGRYLPSGLSSAEREQFRRDAATRLDVPSFDSTWRDVQSAAEGKVAGWNGALPVAKAHRVLRELREHRNGLVQRMGLQSRFGEL